MALYRVTSRQTVYEQTTIEASSEEEALQLAFVNCSEVDWDIIDANDFDVFEAWEIK
jgi:hypothetical protein